MNPYDLFNAVSGLKIAVGVEDEAQFISEVNKDFSKIFRLSHNNLITCGVETDCGFGEEE